MDRTLPRIICIGLANVDVIANVSDEFLSSHGMTKGVSNILDACTTGTILSILENPSCHPGGSSANTAFGISGYDVPVQFIGKAGDDAYADIFRRGFENTPVLFNTPAHSQRMTSVCLTLVTPDKNRTFAFCTDTAGWFVEPDDLPEARADLTVYAESNTGLMQAGGGRSLMEEISVRYDSIPLILNLTDAAIVRNCRATIGSLLARSAETCFIGNVEEIKALFETEDFGKAMAMIRVTGKTFAVTDGPNGVHVFKGNDYHHVPAEPLAEARIVNTVGAGDQFAAGFVAGLVMSMTPEVACGQGIHAATSALQQVAARPKIRRIA